MRAKKAKSMRAMARKLTEGMPEREYKEGSPRVLIRDCTRSFYKRLKRTYMLQKFKHHQGEELCGKEKKTSLMKHK